MEIRDWLRGLGDRARLLVIIPLAAALIALLIGAISPTKYRSVATVPLACAGEDGGPITLVCTQQASDFSAAVESQAVRDSVAQESGVNVGDLGEVMAKRSGQSSLMEITYVGTDESTVKSVAEAHVRAAYRLLGQSNLDAAEARASAARDLLDSAEKALQDAEEAAGLIYSEDLIGALGTRYTAWLDELNSADTDAARLEAQEKVDQIGAKLSAAQELELLNSRRVAALTVLIGASSDVANAEGILRKAETQGVATTTPRALSKLQAVTQNVLFAAVFGLVLAIGLLILLVLLENGKQLLRPASSDGDPDAPAELERRRAAGRP